MADTTDTVEDSELLVRWRDGDKKAGNQLFDRNFADVKKFFARKVSNPALVADLVQRTFERCINKIENFEGRSSFRAFLIGIARIILLEHYRGSRYTSREISVEEQPIADLDPTPFLLVERDSERKFMIHLLRRLPLDTQIIAELYFFENLPARQVAEVLGQPEGTVRGRIRSCRKQVETLVHKFAESPEQLESTLMTLGTWAKRVREQI